jgi:spore germination protein (amino acid permease)
MSVKVNETQQVSSFFVLFLVYGVQVGIGVLTYQRVLVKSTGTDSWITVIFAGLIMQVILWMMFRLLERSGGDIVAIHKELLGKWIGGFFTILICLYFAIMGLVVLRSYTELVQVWMFPHISYWQVAAIVVVITYSIITGGFRPITGIAFLSIVYSTPLLFTLFFPLAYANYDTLLPMFQHTPWSLMLSTQKMILNYEGFGVILFFYPFIKKPKEAKKWAHIGMTMTTTLYIALLLVCLVYFNKNQLSNILWPTIEIWKIVDLPFMERFEYIGITIWLFVILPNICLTIWAATRGIKRLMNFNQRISVMVLLIVIFIVGSFLNSRQSITKLNDLIGEFGFYFLCGYIPLLFIYQTIVLKVKKRHVQA